MQKNLNRIALMPAITFPGIHPSFRIDSFSIDEQRVLRRLSDLFHLTSDGEIVAATSSKYRYALIKPSHKTSGLVHSERELMIVFSEYSEFQPRTIDAFDRILLESADEFRIEKVVRLLVSADESVTEKLKALFVSKPDAPVIVPFHFSDIKQNTSDQEIFDRIREFAFSRDLFSMSSPLRSDLYFYGRSSLIHEIVAKLSSGENFGLFGLRRSGKTSIVNGIARTLSARNLGSIIIDCQSPGIHQRRWYELLYYIVQQLKLQHSLKVNLRNV